MPEEITENTEPVETPEAEETPYIEEEPTYSQPEETESPQPAEDEVPFEEKHYKVGAKFGLTPDQVDVLAAHGLGAHRGRQAVRGGAGSP